MPANFKSFEGSLSGEVTLTFEWRPRMIEIINDSTSLVMRYKFHSSEDFATLYPSEAFSADMTVKEVILSGADDYRVRGIG